MAQITLNSTGVASSGALTLQSNGTTNAVTVDTSQNVGIGTSLPQGSLDVTATGATVNQFLTGGAGNNSVTGIFRIGSGSGRGASIQGFRGASSNIHSLDFYTYNSADVFGMRLDSSGNLLVGATSGVVGGERLSISSGSQRGAVLKNSSSGSELIGCWNSATTGDNGFAIFWTEASPNQRGSITYNRAGGLVMYNQTSDYRAKDISGPIIDSGALIDSVPVYMGKMKDATQERPMFLAHETPNYAHTGVKDAVDADGKPVYQQMDASALIPVMWAEIQDLRKRLAAAGI